MAKHFKRFFKRVGLPGQALQTFFKSVGLHGQTIQTSFERLGLPGQTFQTCFKRLGSLAKRSNYCFKRLPVEAQALVFSAAPSLLKLEAQAFKQMFEMFGRFAQT